MHDNGFQVLYIYVQLQCASTGRWRSAIEIHAIFRTNGKTMDERNNCLYFVFLLYCTTCSLLSNTCSLSFYIDARLTDSKTIQSISNWSRRANIVIHTTQFTTDYCMVRTDFVLAYLSFLESFSFKFLQWVCIAYDINNCWFSGTEMKIRKTAWICCWFIQVKQVYNRNIGFLSDLDLKIGLFQGNPIFFSDDWNFLINLDFEKIGIFQSFLF